MKRNVVWLLLLGFVALMLTGCGGGGGGGGAGTDPTIPGGITLSADAAATTVGTVITLTADVKTTTGVAVKDGTAVAFSTDKGTLSAPTAKTINGKATITITSSVYTSAAITATVAGKTSTTTVLFDDPTLPATVSLAKSLSQSMIGRSVTITAAVKNGAGTPVADGTTVTFATTGGTLSAASATTTGGVATVTLLSNATGNYAVTGSVSSVKSTISGTADVAYVPVSVVLAADAAVTTKGTTVNLTATVTLPGGVPVPDGTAVAFATDKGNLTVVSGTTTNGKAIATIGSSAYAQANVTATAAGVLAATAITFSDPSFPATVNLSSTLPQSPLGFPVTVSAVVKDGTGAAVADGTTVTFTGTGGTLSVASATTTGGVATVTLTSSAQGTIKVTGSVSTPAGAPQGTVDISFVPVTVTLTADAVGTVTTGTVVTLTTDVKLPGGGAAPDGTPVTFAATGGTLSATAATTFSGKALVTLTGTAYGPVTVTATATGVSAQANVMFDDPTLPTTINLTHTPTQGIKDNPAGVTVSATVRDGNGNLVADGTAVTFTSNGGTLASATTTTAGVATVNLTSAALGTITVTGSVTSVKGTITGTDAITFIKDPVLPASMTVSTSQAAPVYANSAPYVVTVNVQNGIPGPVADGTVVNFTVTGVGTLSVASAATVGGTASVTLFSTAAGSATVTATVATDGTVAATTPTLVFALRPTKAIVKLSTFGTLPPATNVGGWQIVMTIPDSVSISSTSGQIDTSALYTSGAAAGSFVAGSYSAGPPQSISAALISANGFGIGETATLEFVIAPSGPIPGQSDFVIAPGYQLTDPTTLVNLTTVGITLGISSFSLQ